MKQVLLVFLGGGAGSVLRYGISRMLQAGTILPLGTLVVNVLGSLLIGFFLGAAYRHQLLTESMTLLLVTGFCGGFTTFSAFSYENQVFLKSGDFLGLGLYIFSTLVLGIAAVFAGFFFSRFV